MNIFDQLVRYWGGVNEIFIDFSTFLLPLRKISLYLRQSLVKTNNFYYCRF